MNAKDPTSRIEIANFASIYRGNIMDISNETMTVELMGLPIKSMPLKIWFQVMA